MIHLSERTELLREQKSEQSNPKGPVPGVVKPLLLPIVDGFAKERGVSYREAVNVLSDACNSLYTAASKSLKHGLDPELENWCRQASEASGAQISTLGLYYSWIEPEIRRVGGNAVHHNTMTGPQECIIIDALLSIEIDEEFCRLYNMGPKIAGMSRNGSMTIRFDCP